MNEHDNDIESLIAKFLAGEASPEEAMMLEDWMDESIINREAFNQAEAAWQFNKSRHPQPDLQKIYATLPIARKRVLRAPLRIAAAIVLLTVAAIFTYRAFAPTVAEDSFLTRKSFDKPVSFTLPEKSAITLNKNSSLRYEKVFTRVRRMYLTGEAYFEVTPDDTKPFVIVADALEVKVLGTVFNVLSYPADTLVHVHVVHGRVQMKHATDSLVLLAGDRGFYHKQTHKLWIEKTTAHNNLGYATHAFEYSDQPLREILNDLSAAYGVTFELENTSVMGCRLTGEYRGMTLPVILEVITKSLDLKYTVNGNRVYISGDGCL